jgi:DNA-binding transcriptional LysR family regulator
MNNFERLFDVSGLSLDRLRTFLRVVEAGNLSKAAQGDPTKQSQFSRQIKELECFFGVALSRRVGRRIEITDEGHRLGLVIRRHFRELDDFREAMSGRSVNIRFGSQGSVINWMLLPRLEGLRKMLGNAVVECEQMRSSEVVRAVADGRLDFGIVREDAVTPKMKRWPLGNVGYSVFAANSLWKGCSSVEELVQNAPFAELLPGGQFSERWQEWLAKESLVPKVSARVSSFMDLAGAVHFGFAAVLPDLAAVDFDPKRFAFLPISGFKKRTLVLIANTRSLERSGVASGVAPALAELLKLV